MYLVKCSSTLVSPNLWAQFSDVKERQMIAPTLTTELISGCLNRMWVNT